MLSNEFLFEALFESLLFFSIYVELNVIDCGSDKKMIAQITILNFYLINLWR